MSPKKIQLSEQLRELMVLNRFPRVKSPKSKGYSWLRWASAVQAIAQNGKTYSKNPFDLERYDVLQEIAEQMIACQSHHKHAVVKKLFKEEKWYATPKVDVRAAIFKDDQILLVQELDKDWSLPGGWCDINYSPAETAVKEVKEESGYDVKVIKIAGVLDKHKHAHPPQLPHAYKCFFICEIIGGQATSSIETTEVKFFPLENLPNISLHRVTKEQIFRCYEHYLDLSIPTDYD